MWFKRHPGPIKVNVVKHRYRPELVNYERQPVDWVRAAAFGEGFINYPAFFSGLRDGSFDGVATYEMCSTLHGGGSLDKLDACARGYLDWMASRKLAG